MLCFQLFRYLHKGDTCVAAMCSMHLSYLCLGAHCALRSRPVCLFLVTCVVYVVSSRFVSSYSIVKGNKSTAMQESRKSILGTRGLKPVRLDTLNCPGPSRSKSPLGSITPHPRSCKRSVPIRESDVKELGILLSSIKKAQAHSDQRRLKTPTSRRCLYKDNDFKTPGGRKRISSQKNIEYGAQGSTKRTKPSKLPRASSSRLSISRSKGVNSQEPKFKLPVPVTHVSKVLSTKTNRSTLLKPSCPSQATSGNSSQQQDLLLELKSSIQEQRKLYEEAQLIIETQKNMLNAAQGLIEEQKNMLDEARNVFSTFSRDQRSILESMQSILMVQKGNRNDDSISTDHEFTELEKQFQGGLCLSGAKKALLVKPSIQVSDAAGKEILTKSQAAFRTMRKSFPFLHTPKSSSKTTRTPKIKTPRSSLSARVKAQLELMNDE